MIRTKYRSIIATFLTLMTISAVISSPSASAATQTLTYDCSVTARNVTRNVSPGDVLNFTSRCGAVFLGAYNSSVISSSSGSGFPSRSFVVSASLAPGSYADAIELYSAYHNFYRLVYASRKRVAVRRNQPQEGNGLQDIDLQSLQRHKSS